MEYYGKGKSYNDIKGLKTKRLTEHFIEQLEKSNTMEIWSLYNRMFDEKRELTRDLSNAMIRRNSHNTNQSESDLEVLNYCSWTYTSQEFNNLISLVVQSYYQKCEQLRYKEALSPMEKYFMDIMIEDCGFKYKFSAVGQLKITIPIKTVYQRLLREEKMRKALREKVFIGG